MINVFFQLLNVVMSLLWCGKVGREKAGDLIQVKRIRKME